MSQLSFHEDTRRARGDITKRIAKTLGITPRQFRKYIKLFEGPPELLQAVLDGGLKVSDAFDVQKLSPEESKPILKSLRKNSVNAKIQDLLKRTGNPVPNAPKLASVLANLFKVGDQLAGHAAACETPLTDSQRHSLAELNRLLAKILRGSSPGTEK